MAVQMIGDGRPDGMQFNGGSFNTAASPQILTYNGDKALEMYTTCASTNASTSWEPVLFSNVMSGAGQVGGRVKVDLTISAAAGGWSNAFKAMTTYGAAGSTTGLGSTICAEMVLSAGTTVGNYAPVEIELVLGSGAVTGTRTAFMHMQVSGADKATMDTYGNLFDLDGLTVASGKMFQANTAAASTHCLRCNIGGTAYYVMLTSAGA